MNSTSRRDFICGLASLAAVPCLSDIGSCNEDIERTIYELVLSHIKKHIPKATQGYYYLKKNNGMIKAEDAYKWGFCANDGWRLENELYEDTKCYVDGGKLHSLRFLAMIPTPGMIGVICGTKRTANSETKYMRIGATDILKLCDFTINWCNKTYDDIGGMVTGNFHKWIEDLKGLEFDPNWTEKDCCRAIKHSYVPIANKQFMEGVGKKLDVTPHENQKGVYDIKLEWIYGEMWQDKNDIKVLHETVRI
jgi:hypothetical protein